MEQTVLNTTKTEHVNIFKFAVLQKMAIEYFLTIDKELQSALETHISTTHKQRFSEPNRRTRKQLEKQYQDEIKTFKNKFNAYKKKNEGMFNMLESFRKTDADAIEDCVEKTYDFIDSIIIKKNEQA